MFMLIKLSCDQGAFWGLTVGLVIGVIRFAWESAYGQTMCQDSGAPAIISKVHYLHYGIISFCIVCIVCAVISLATQPIDKKYVSVW